MNNWNPTEVEDVVHALSETSNYIFLRNRCNVCISSRKKWYFANKLSKGLFKRSQHIGPTSSNIVGCNLLASFEHYVGWMLDNVGRYWLQFKLAQNFRPTS